MIEITITICGIKKHGVLVKLIITKIDIAKFYKFLISEFDLLKVLVYTTKSSCLVYYFLLKLADFYYNSVALISY